MRLIFDLEADGLLDSATVIHCLVAQDIDTEEVHDFGPDRIADGIALLSKASLLVAHNGVKYDLPLLKKLHGFTPSCPVLDTMILARLWKNGDVLREEDFKARKLPGKMLGSHSLEAWGYRLGVLKGDYTSWCKEQGIEDPWACWRPEMHSYCIQDCAVTLRLYRALEGANLSPQAVDLEHRVAWIIARQERRGFAFDEDGAHRLLAVLQAKRAELEDQLRAAFRPWWRPKRPAKDALFVPKRDDRKHGYTAGAAFTKVELHVFDPNSRADFADRLIALYGWEPSEFTDKGQPKVDEKTLGELPWPEAKLAAQYFMVQKRLGQLATGDEAWLSHVRNGRIHGSVNSLGAHTGRMTHSSPNIAQVPSVRAPYGKECRSLFRAGEGYVLVGMDASAIELRNLAGYMAPYDKGAYVRVVLSSDDPEVKAAGNDLHSMNARALGLDPKKRYKVDGQEPTGRDIAKVWFSMGTLAEQSACKQRRELREHPSRAILSQAL